MFDLDRAVKDGCRTRDGRPVRIICTDRKSEFWPVIGLVEDEGQEHPTGFHTDGSAHCTRLDLVNLPEAHEVTVQLYRADTNDGWAASVTLDPGTDRSHRCGLAAGGPWPEWGKPVTVRIENDA